MSEARTACEILVDLREARYVTELRLAPTKPRFTALLNDPEFAKTAQEIVSAKLATLRHDEGVFQPRTSARAQTLAGWQRVLAKIEKSLHNSGSQTLR